MRIEAQLLELAALRVIKDRVGDRNRDAATDGLLF
jgi:hypothetical protein